MASMSYAHRILARAAGRPVGPGDVVSVEPDRTVLSGARVPSTVLEFR